MDEFAKRVRQAYQQHKRELPWRNEVRPYQILVSEVMLQQTQVNRVLEKFNTFIESFPTVEDLAQAPLKDVLKLWSGLGYNCRAKYLHGTAKLVISQHGGRVPSDRNSLEQLPGIGTETAGAILVYAYNKPEVFIETNIRAVYIHHFFPEQAKVADKEIRPIVKRTLDTSNPREWYWALMDYGTYLKKALGNPAKRSRHHVKQSRFEGSRRQLRGQVLKELLARPQPSKTLAKNIDDSRLQSALDDLAEDGLIERTKQGHIQIAD